MIKEVASHIPGVEIMPMISLGIFFLFFLGLSIWVLRAKKEDMDRRSRLPLDQDETEMTKN
jgi:cytochrome c oxidase cbb3-type subunit 4